MGTPECKEFRSAQSNRSPIALQFTSIGYGSWCTTRVTHNGKPSRLLTPTLAPAQADKCGVDKQFLGRIVE